MKKIIALYGAANKGKTTTLNILVDLLAVVSDCYNIERHYDSKAMFVINNKNIGVCTSGDNQEEIKNNIEFFYKNECEIIITATRTKGEGVSELEKFTKKQGIEIDWIMKENNLELNGLVAADIFRRIINEIYPKC